MQIGNTIVTVDKKKAATIKWAIIGVCCVVAAPVAMVVLKGVLALAAAGLIACGSIFFGPVLAQKMAVQRVKQEIQEATKNPIETLELEYNQMESEAKQFEAEVKTFAAEADSFAQQTQDFKKEFPEDAPMFEKQLAAYRDLQTVKETAFQQALADLQKMAGVVKRAKALWKMSQSTQRMNAIAGARDEDVFARIRRETALDSVRTATNASFAQVRVELLKTVQSVAPQQAALGAPTDNAMAALQQGVQQAQQVPVNRQ
jgi:hypothetical protein